MVPRVRIAHYVQGFISFTLEELKGVPEDVISGYTKRTEGGKELYDVAHKTPDIYPLVCRSRCFFGSVVSRCLCSSSMRKVLRHVAEDTKATKLVWN
jgi:hypothetical protein